MTAPIRPLPPGPKTVTDTWGFWLLDPKTGTVVGRQGPLARARVVSALRLGEWGNTQWHHLKKPTTIVDTWGFFLIDPVTRTVVGREGISVQRCLTAAYSEDMRRANFAYPLPPKPPPPTTGEDVPTSIIIFNSSGVYVPSPNIVSAVVECIGGGGGGGNGDGNTTDFGAGGGGGSGGYSRSVLIAAQIPASVAVNIGAGGGPAGFGGATSFGGLVIANGGAPGHDTFEEVGGNGGLVGVGQFLLPGSAGQTGDGAGPDPNVMWWAWGGIGGTMWGGSVQTVQITGSHDLPNAINGVNAVPNTGAGGTGCASIFTSAVPLGGNGGSGVCVITEYTRM